MDLQLLKVFYTTAQEGSISKAAQKLNFAQSNVTHKIQILESDLQTQLFYRHNRGITITPAGQILCSYAKKICHLIQEARSAVCESSLPFGPLLIGTIEATAAARLPAMLAKYHHDYPAVDLSLNTAPSEQLIQAVLHYELNGAFVVGPVEHPDLIQEKVNDEKLVLVTPVSHPPVASIHDVQLRTLLVFRNGCTYRAKITQLLKDEGIVPAKHMEFGSFETIIGCVSAGLGISLLPHAIVAESERQGRIRTHEIGSEHTTVSTVFIRRSDALMTPTMTTFLSEIKAHFS